MVTELSLTSALPAFAKEFMQALRSQGQGDLASQIESLPLVDRCRCGDAFCGTFYTAERPDGAYGPGHTNITVECEFGIIVLDLVDDAICCVEVLDRPDVRKVLRRVLP